MTGRGLLDPVSSLSAVLSWSPSPLHPGPSHALDGHVLFVLCPSSATAFFIFMVLVGSQIHLALLLNEIPPSRTIISSFSKSRSLLSCADASVRPSAWFSLLVGLDVCGVEQDSRPRPGGWDSLPDSLSFSAKLPAPAGTPAVCQENGCDTAPDSDRTRGYRSRFSSSSGLRRPITRCHLECLM